MRICSLLLCTTFLVSSITSSYAEISTHKLIRQDNSELIYYLDKQAEHNKTLLVLMQGSDCNSIKIILLFKKPLVDGYRVVMF
ncbi:hypothetical protein I3679_008755 [Proteus mirabilis]|uniref:Uncharacterized protein n=1 Tax=Proteus mirabilis TaxID=584 RepID=A0ABD5LV50_PROMI|nr:Uncharacterised protein [Proteus mirabilis]